MSLDQTFIKAFHTHRVAGDLFHHGQRQAHEVFQTSTIDALLEGVYDGEMIFGELARHGDFGLGTFNALDGEMTAVDGVFYQIKSDGRVTRVDAAMKTPFAVVMFFDPTLQVELETETDFAAFTAALGEIAGSLAPTKILPSERLRPTDTQNRQIRANKAARCAALGAHD